MGLDEVPTLNYGGKGSGGDDEGAEGEAAAGGGEKTIFNVNVTGFGEKSKIKVRTQIYCTK